MLGSKESRTFKREFDAWIWVYEHYPDTGWYYDDIASEKAGYQIYRDTEEIYNYICCLGSRLEINLKEGNKTINLWIEEDISNSKDNCSEDYRNYKLSINEINNICDSLYLCCNAFASNDIQNFTYKNIDDIMAKLELIKKLRKDID